jgi:hypothetical protein
MRRASSLLYCGLPLLLSVSFALPNARASGTASPAPDKTDASATVVLPPKVEAKVKELLDKIKEAQVKVWDPQIKQKLDEVTTVTSIGDQQRLALEPAAKQAVAAWTDSWLTKIGGEMRKQYSLMPSEQVLKMLEQQIAQSSAFGRSDFSGELTPPFDQDAWIKAMHQVLTPDQMALWDKAETDRKAKIENEIAKGLQAGVDRIRTQQTQEVNLACREIELAVGLPKDRSDKLEALGKSVVDQTSQMWGERVRKALFSMGDLQRSQFSQGRFWMGEDEKEIPTEQAAWQDGVAAILTPDEKSRLQAEKDQRKSKREEVMGQMMLMELDEKLALTEEQRQKLKPLTDRLIKDVPQLFPKASSGESYYGYSPDTFLSAANRANEAELKPILDKVQMKRWKDLSKADGAAEDGSDNDDAKTKPASAPEDVDLAISRFLYDKAQLERKRAIEINLLQAEDAARVAGLSAEVADQLRVAALGTAESYLNNWKWFTEQQIRSQLQDVTPQNVRQRLQSIQAFFFQRNYGLGNSSNLWDETVKASLTPKEQETWKKETDARSAFKDKSIGDFVMAEFDRETRLTPQQWDKMEPIVSGVIHDYGKEMSQMFAFGNGMEWYMEGPYILMPMAGVPDAQLKGILTKDQLDSWHSSQQCGTATSLWQNVQQIHDQRVRAQH